MGILLLTTKLPASIEFSEVVSLSDSLTKLASKPISEVVSLSDFLTLTKIQFLSIDEAVSLSDSLTLTRIQSLSVDEVVSLSDALSAYAFRPNKPLQRYQTRQLVSMSLTQTHHFSSEEIDDAV